ncbi:hypothetical protein [Brevundimonas sp. Root1423]|uniref:hypothetical protein n=1 Tax=Brevundimonas sp. Root1423 TaxID=1736462 RepID=UPI0006FB9610|nr:hypothetical protein [Brevundimonas sp. Root1423]KQY96532.1 hypothetical protein ASD25_01310 [Brevundimonas sp. Root1423]
MTQRVRDRLKARSRATLEHVRHARHPLHGWRKWSLILLQAVIGVVLLFAAVNLTLSLTAFRGANPLDRSIHELRSLWFSPADGKAMSAGAFEAVYGQRLGSRPAAADIRAYFSREASRGIFLLDHVMADHIVARFGRIDGRTLPSGVYVGARALGPDGAPWVGVTKWPAHYLMFPRHAYILVVPESGPALVFSASQNAKFDPDLPEGNQLGAQVTTYDREAYDFPSSGQALHEITLITDDPAQVAAAPAALERARAALDARNLRYGMLAPNSNTVVGCILEASGAISREQRSRILLSIRAPGIGATCW